MFADQPVRFWKLRSFRAEHFPNAGPQPWLDRSDALTQLGDMVQRGAISGVAAEQCRHWVANGYVILPRLLEEQVLDEVWRAYEGAIRAGRITLPVDAISEDDPYPGRCLNPHKRVKAFCRFLKHPELLRWIRLLMGREPKALQTIASHKGSQQAAHSDSIHMTTYPLGYLTAAWIACEDIHPDSGPLVYYPGSHRLPYVFSKDVGISESDFKTSGYAAYQAKYEPYIQHIIERHGLEPHAFHASKGDVLIWHANLLHGGALRRNVRLSRRAVVCHFFAKGCFVYHDLAAARSRQQYFGTCLLRDQAGRLRLFDRQAG